MQDSPEKVETAIFDYEGLMEQSAERKGNPNWKRQYAVLLYKQAEALLAWNDWNQAEQLATTALNLAQGNAPAEANPQALLERIRVARQAPPATRPPVALRSEESLAAANDGGLAPGAQTNGEQTLGSQSGSPLDDLKQQTEALLRQSRQALAEGDAIRAERLARQAHDLGVPDTAFAPNEDRPALVMLDIQRRAATNRGITAEMDHPNVTQGVLPRCNTFGPQPVERRAGQRAVALGGSPRFLDVAGAAFGRTTGRRPTESQFRRAVDTGRRTSDHRP